MEPWALVFLIVTLPFGLYATWTDLKYLKIPNIVPLSLVVVFVIVGPMVLEFDEYLRSLAYGLIALLASILIHAAGLVPAGDLKYTSAIIPFVDTGQLLSFTMFVALASIMAVLTHLIFGWVGLAPKGWASWEGKGWKRRFPYGFALTGGLITYLAAYLVGPV
ncbi:MAG: hypothetical protein L3J37_01560 [Rhodobacteraceae bacterium]|nr:hypothetical protein [Paracoccaceae bacterium]